MKRNRQTKMIAIIALVIAVAGMSLGFAAFSSTLTISSSASVTPDSSTFSVGFYPDTTAALANAPANPVIANTTGGASASELMLEEGATSISELNASFTAPGGSVTYSFYVGNSGEYDAYLRAINFNNVTGSNLNKVCTAGTGATASLVDAACDDITISVNVHDITATSTNSSISGKVLYKKTFAPITITIEYAANGDRADGPFSVEFGEISLDYSTVDGSNLVSFMINITTYQAEDGMTLLEWINSPYNTGGFDEYSEFCYYTGGGYAFTDLNSITISEGINFGANKCNAPLSQ